MPSIVDAILQQGREEGREVGRQEGREEGFAKGIIKLLKTKFYDLPQIQEERILSIRDLSTLEAIMDIAIKAESLDQFEQQLSKLP